ncbi:Chalcone--flavanone isomerase 1 [Linum grandiflorum]
MPESLQPVSVTEIQVDGVPFPASVKPPASKSSHFLAGAGVRGLEIEGNFVKFTAIGVYVEDKSVAAVSEKWKGKTTEELKESVGFYRDIVSGPFEKLTRVTMILPLSGAQYSEKVVENCVAAWKSMGVYTDAEGKATDKFIEIFKDQTFPPGASILFTQFPQGSLAISFSKDGTVPETAAAVIDNKPLSEAVLWSIIGEHGVSPAAKQSLAERFSVLLKAED